MHGCMDAINIWMPNAYGYCIVTVFNSTVTDKKNNNNSNETCDYKYCLLPRYCRLIYFVLSSVM